MREYKNLVRRILTSGQEYPDRTKTGCLGIFGHQMRFDLAEGFPLVTVKRTWMKGVIHELLWMLRGETNIACLQKEGVHIWDEWADEDGNLGPVYGAQWRRFRSFEYSNDSESDQEVVPVEADQLAVLLRGLECDPFSRRHIISAWAPSELPVPGLSPQQNVREGKMALAPCHCLVQFHVSHAPCGSKVLSCQLYQRSADVFLGVPFNIASYALLTHMLAYHLGMLPGEFIWTGGDCHLYSNHVELARMMLTRQPKARPLLRLNYHRDRRLWDVQPGEIEVAYYNPHPSIPAKVAV